LRDTIRDYHATPNSTGFLFQEATIEALVSAIHSALRVYQEKRPWQQMQKRGMSEDFSWERSADEYHKLYLTLLDKISH
jgi:starch synthase